MYKRQVFASSCGASPGASPGDAGINDAIAYVVSGTLDTRCAMRFASVDSLPDSISTSFG